MVEPTIYLLAFGFGFGSLVSVVGGYRYIEFLGTGVVATAVLFSSAFAGMFATFIRRVFQKSYDAILATPVDVHELVAAEATWIASKSGVYGCAPLLVAMAFGLDPSWGMLLVPLIGFLTGLGFALFGIWVSAVVPSIDSFNYIISGVLTPLFLVAGTFFPIDGLPDWARAPGAAQPALPLRPAGARRRVRPAAARRPLPRGCARGVRRADGVPGRAQDAVPADRLTRAEPYAGGSG